MTLVSTVRQTLFRIIVISVGTATRSFAVERRGSARNTSRKGGIQPRSRGEDWWLEYY